MSVPYESTEQRNSSLDALVAANQEDMDLIELTPYEPILYAIPKEQRDTELQLLQRAATFQPELYRRIEPLATKKELGQFIREMEQTQEEYMSQAIASLTETNLQTITRMQRTFEQAGSQQESFISDSDSMLATRTRELKDVINGLERKLVQFLVFTGATALTASILVSVLLWRLLG